MVLLKKHGMGKGRQREGCFEEEEINPMRQVLAIVDGRFKLFESHAILKYLSCAFPGVSDSWLEDKTLKRKKVFATLKVLGTVVEELTKEIAPEDADKLISEER
ncbi:glutathione S-transferase T1-like [Dioscorea cayenensis subsp. rotundata]|uniref:Glutathione S-transferase T1-like n=1 Tax=Dioscorea cayennensis subsp. rotundata TaxID=55577 RepID=A0AB40BNJ7_DIOCR|nr:glutathione S-transferase T1-like [Dioscorea cayenensis subsp. rotundata]